MITASTLKAFNKKTVLITGNSGFKGSWLSAWLLKLGAKVIGLSLDEPSVPSHFNAIALESRMFHIWGDIRNINTCVDLVEQHKPDYIFHLAAQPLVRSSYSNPYDTFTTNTGGTLNILEAIRLSNLACTAVFITSDKSYDNVEQIWGYRESDRLGGKDPYSGSKGAAEMVLRSYSHSFFAEDSPVRVAVGRAGNVIGGGDWAFDRIIPDAVRAWDKGSILNIRNPNATRPWQHVLEPLSGYLTLAAALANDSSLMGEAFNFGPPPDQSYSVAELLKQMELHWAQARWAEENKSTSVYEAHLLKLCCDKALHFIGWKPILTFAETVEMTATWYRSYYNNHQDIWSLTESQIEEYQVLGLNRGAVWTR